MNKVSSKERYANFQAIKLFNIFNDLFKWTIFYIKKTTEKHKNKIRI